MKIRFNPPETQFQSRDWEGTPEQAAEWAALGELDAARNAAFPFHQGLDVLVDELLNDEQRAVVVSYQDAGGSVDILVYSGGNEIRWATIE